MNYFWKGFDKASSASHLNYLKRIGALGGSKAGTRAAKRTNIAKQTTPDEVLRKTTLRNTQGAQRGSRRYADM